MIQATVKWFNTAKGFGFVAPEDGSGDAFLHISVLERSGFKHAPQGAVISCHIETGPRGLQVAEVLEMDKSTVEQAPEMSDADSIVAEVKFFSRDKGYGFAVPDVGERDIFIGMGTVERSGLDQLTPGTKVKLTVREGPKGPMAEHVSLVE